MLRAGLTGGIGSGKSTVASIFETLRIPVYYADTEARRLMETLPPLKDQLIRAFGQEIYLANGQLDRTRLAGIVFGDDRALQELNQLVHPYVRDDFEQWASRQSNAPYVLEEAALLVESGAVHQLDKLIVVTAPEELRIQRVITRDLTTREAVLSRIRKQLPEEKLLEYADYIIDNSGNAMLIEQIFTIHNTLIK